MRYRKKEQCLRNTIKKKNKSEINFNQNGYYQYNYDNESIYYNANIGWEKVKMSEFNSAKLEL